MGPRSDGGYFEASKETSPYRLVDLVLENADGDMIRPIGDETSRNHPLGGFANTLNKRFKIRAQHHVPEIRQHLGAPIAQVWVVSYPRTRKCFPVPEHGFLFPMGEHVLLTE